MERVSDIGCRGCMFNSPASVAVPVGPQGRARQEVVPDAYQPPAVLQLSLLLPDILRTYSLARRCEWAAIVRTECRAYSRAIEIYMVHTSAGRTPDTPFEVQRDPRGQERVPSTAYWNNTVGAGYQVSFDDAKCVYLSS